LTSVRRSLDFAIDVVTSSLWALAAFFVAARLISSDAGLLLALAVFVTAMTFIVSNRSQERRARHIAAGVCPRCQSNLVSEHEHRRWDTVHSEWLPPLTTWQCEACDFQQEAPLACETCPGG
jgi:RNase P subunit RPR2